jgi:hypothetical protein
VRSARKSPRTRIRVQMWKFRRVLVDWGFINRKLRPYMPKKAQRKAHRVGSVLSCHRARTSRNEVCFRVEFVTRREEGLRLVMAFFNGKLSGFATRGSHVARSPRATAGRDQKSRSRRAHPSLCERDDVGRPVRVPPPGRLGGAARPSRRGRATRPRRDRRARARRRLSPRVAPWLVVLISAARRPPLRRGRARGIVGGGAHPPPRR